MMKIAIDLGQTNTHVAELIKGKPNVTINSRQKSYTPSVVSVVDKLPSVGHEILKSEIKEENVVSRMKGIIARLHDKTLLEKYCKCWRIRMEFRGETERVPRFLLTENNDEGFTVEEIVALLFAYVSQGLNKIDGAVMTVPSSFDKLQRQMVRDAATIAKIRILGEVEETKAAAKAFVMSENVDKSLTTLLVFQMGGGSIDIAIFEVNGTKVELLGNVASSCFGGDDFDKNTLDYVTRQKDEYAEGEEPGKAEGHAAEISLPQYDFRGWHGEESSNILIDLPTVEEKTEENEGGEEPKLNDRYKGVNSNKNEVNQTTQKDCDKPQIEDISRETDYREWTELMEACGKAKQDLSYSDDVRITTEDKSYQLTKQVFKEINKPLLQLIECMIDMATKVTGKDKQEIGAYILVGNSTLMPSVADIVKNKIGKGKQKCLVNSDDAAVIGAAHYANELKTPWFWMPSSTADDNILDNNEMGELLIKGGEIVSAYPHSCEQAKEKIREILKSSVETFTENNNSEKDIIVRFLIRPKQPVALDESITKIKKCGEKKLRNDRLKYLEIAAQKLQSSIDHLEPTQLESEAKYTLKSCANKCKAIVSWIKDNETKIESLNEKELRKHETDMQSTDKDFQKMYTKLHVRRERLINIFDC